MGQVAEPISSRDPRAIVANGRVLGIMAGTPRCADWGEVNSEASSAIRLAREKLAPTEPALHRRGAFPAYQVGLSHGGGQGSPQMRVNLQASPILDELLKKDAFKRIVGFTNCK